MENIMTSYEPPLEGFTDVASPRFEKETREDTKLNELKNIHEGILAAYEERMHHKYGSPSKELADEILNLLNDSFSVMNADFFENNILEDEFCNRAFNLKKMIMP